VTDRFLVVLDSLVQAASDVRRTSDAVRDGLVGALDDEVAVGHDLLRGVLAEFGDAALARFVEHVELDPRLRARLRRLMDRSS